MKLTSSVLLYKSDDVSIIGMILLVGKSFHGDVFFSQVEEDAFGEEEMRPIVLLQVVEDHHGASRPVKLRVQRIDEVTKFGGRGSSAEDRPELVCVIETIGESSGGNERQLPVGREPPHRGHGVHAARSDERVRFVVEFRVHGDDLRFVFGARARGVLHAEVQQVYPARSQQSAFQDVLARHAYRRQHARRCPRVFNVVREQHGHRDVIPCIRSAPCQDVANKYVKETMHEMRFMSHSSSGGKTQIQAEVFFLK